MVHLTALGLLAALAMVTMSPTIAAPSFQRRDVGSLADLKRKLTLYEVLRNLISTNNQDVSSEMMEKNLEANEDSGYNSDDLGPSSKRDITFKFNRCRYKCSRPKRSKGMSLKQ